MERYKNKFIEIKYLLPNNEKELMANKNKFLFIYKTINKYINEKYDKYKYLKKESIKEYKFRMKCNLTEHLKENINEVILFTKYYHDIEIIRIYLKGIHDILLK